MNNFNTGKSILLLLLLLLNFNCITEPSKKVGISRQSQEEIANLKEKIDSLETQLKKCDNWVDFLEEDK